MTLIIVFIVTELLSFPLDFSLNFLRLPLKQKKEDEEYVNNIIDIESSRKTLFVNESSRSDIKSIRINILRTESSKSVVVDVAKILNPIIKEKSSLIIKKRIRSHAATYQSQRRKGVAGAP